jgi:hypothetical protein
VHPLLFWTVTLLLVAALTSTVMALRRGIAAQKPAAVITHEQVVQTDAKRRSLAGARALAQAGKHEQAVAAYDAHLARYPESTIARTERDAELRIVASTTNTDSEVTRVAKKPRRGTSAEVAEKKEEPQKKMSRWQRLKKWLAEDPAAAKKRE